jgi:hypothetical protein
MGDDDTSRNVREVVPCTGKIRSREELDSIGSIYCDVIAPCAHMMSCRTAKMVAHNEGKGKGDGLSYGEFE